MHHKLNSLSIFLKKYNIDLYSILKLSSGPIYLYSFVPSDAKDSIKKFGLASSEYIATNKKLLKTIFPDKADQEEWLSRFDENDITLKGPSVFFQKPDIDKLKEINPDHAIFQDEYDLIRINFTKLKKAYPETKVYGLELIPYKDKDYSKLKPKIEHYLTTRELKVFNEMDFEEAWEYYFGDAEYFAPNVPHGVVINDLGYIPFEFLEYVTEEK